MITEVIRNFSNSNDEMERVASSLKNELGMNLKLYKPQVQYDELGSFMMRLSFLYKLIFKKGG